MNFISELFGYPLGWIMWACYKIVTNYGIALIIFTLIAKLLLLPLGIKQQKSMIKMQLIKPKLDEIQKKYAKDPRPFDENCGCPACRNYSRSYIRHLIKAKESLGMRLAVAHNLYFYNNLTKKIREALDGGYFESFYQKYHIALGERNPD